MDRIQLYSHMAIHYADPLDRTFRALGDGTRRAIVARLAAEGRCSAGELREPFEVAQPTISKHLKVLENAGLVRREVTGRVHQFSLNTAELDRAGTWINRHREFWEGTLERLAGYIDHSSPNGDKSQAFDE